MNKQEALNKKEQLEAELKKLQAIIDAPEQSAFDYITERMDGASLHLKVDGFPNLRFAYFKDGKVLIRMWENNKNIRIDRDFWKEITVNYGLIDYQINCLFMEWLDQALNLKSDTTKRIYQCSDNKLEQALNYKLASTINAIWQREC